MIEPFVEKDGEEIHLQVTDENSHIMLCFDNLEAFEKFMEQLEQQRNNLKCPPSSSLGPGFDQRR